MKILIVTRYKEIIKSIYILSIYGSKFYSIIYLLLYVFSHQI
jgi:hypothetical protein